MNFKLALVCAGTLFAGALLYAQPPADSQAPRDFEASRGFEASPGFEASVKAAMAPSIAQQRSAIQKQASTSPLSGAPRRPASSSFFTIPFPPAVAGTADCEPLPAEQLDPLIEAAAHKTGVDAQLVRTVIDQESAGRPCALSAQGAQGLMQLMPATAEQLDVDDPFDPRQNVEAGAKLLKSLLERYKNDPALALSAYNAGPERVDQAGGIPQIPETMDYVTAILEKLRSLTDTKTGHGSTESIDPTPTKNFGW